MSSLENGLSSSLSDLIRTIETSPAADRDITARALAYVRDGVLTGEGPTTAGRVHFSRSIDGADTDWCARILTAAAVAAQPVSRAEAAALFEINAAASERMDEGRFDDLLAKAVVHHAAAASGLPVPPRDVALDAATAIDSWAPARATDLNVEVLEWIAAQMRGRRQSNPKLRALVAGVAKAPPLQPTMAALADAAY
jgi:hypothetical protein